MKDHNGDMRYALSLIRDDRCSCGGRFKWTGVQMRCEQCDGHYGYGIPEHYREMSRDVLLAAERGKPVKATT